MLRIWLAEQGFDVSVAVNGTDALSQVQEEPPDLIVTDQSMPRERAMRKPAGLSQISQEIASLLSAARPPTRGS